MKSTNQTVGLPENWLDTAPQAAYVPSTTDNSLAVGGNLSGYWTYPTYWGTTYVEPRKIRLKLSEVERLRMAAKEDKKLREILQKFTGHIEIEVDFE
jgi:phytoene dehydrogenase-like protein